MKRRSSGSENTGLQRFVRPVLWSLLFGAVACAGLLLLFAAVVTFTGIPHRLIDLLATIALSGSGLVSGYVCARLTKEKGLLLGIFCGGMLFLLVACTNFAVLDETTGPSGFFKLLVMLLASAIGGVLGVNQKVKVKIK